MRLMSMRGGAAVAGTVMVLLTGCSGQTARPTPLSFTHAKGPSARPFFPVQALCAKRVPGAQHAVATTVGQVRRSGLGIVGPSVRVRRFATNEPAANPAGFCYRWLPVRQADEWWGVSYSGATVHIGGFGGVKRDMGAFDGSAFD